MSLNNVSLEGRIPFDLEIKGEDKKYLRFAISTKRDYKQEGEQYYKEDLIICKAFGPKAQFISDYFKKGDSITVVGEIRKDDDYMVGEEKRHGEMYVFIEKAYFGPKSNDDSSAKTNTSKPNTTTASTPPSPFGSQVKTPSPFGKSAK